ncbi:MAG: peptide deformylase [Thermoanaerobaculia bacterium]
MAILPIRIYPDPVLRVHCRQVDEFDGELEKLAADMIETMHAAPGIGLAAPQVGVDTRLTVVDVSVGENEQELHILVNPELLEEHGQIVDVEGCLSIPEITDKVARPEKIRIRAQDLAGKPFELEVAELVARAICHEIDHLNGVLFVDHLTGLRRERAKRKLNRLSRQQETAV